VQSARAYKIHSHRLQSINK